MSVGTHKTHCCEKHGCKYNSETCPVELRQVEQSYSCETCRSVAAIEAEIEQLKAELEWSRGLEARGLDIYDY